MRLESLIRQVMDEKMRLGHTPQQVYRSYWELYIPIINFFKAHNQPEYDPALIEEFIALTDKRYEAGEIQRTRHSKLTCAARTIAHFERTGTYLWTVRKMGSRYHLNIYYTKIMGEFLGSREFHPNTKQDLEWVARRYFNWLEAKGIENISDADQTYIQQYLHECIAVMKSTSVYNVHLYLKQLYKFLAVKGYTQDSYEEFFSFKICRESKMYPAADAETVNAVLNVIDTQTSIGKRDYAIVLLGYRLGLRAADIARLKLSDIHWEYGEIHLVQKKTGNLVVLPLVTDVGEALKDYILNGRPESDYETIFLRATPPFFPFKDPYCIGNQYNVYLRRAGIVRTPGDGRGFHSLRRAAGTNMVTSGTPISTVAQVLGDSCINSTKKYIALDSDHLAECALSFSGIELEAGYV